MPADLKNAFAESCCDGGACSSTLSTQSCGCDPGMPYHCKDYPRCNWGRYENISGLLTAEQIVELEDVMRDTVPAMGWAERTVAEHAMRTFDTGATRNIDHNKYDYEGFLHPEALHVFGEYMHAHRKQRDGSIRDSDNWQKGIPFRTYVKSLVRHTIDLWRMERGFAVTNPDTGQPHTKQELCCAIVFNSMGYLKELLDPAAINVQTKAPT